MSRACLVVLLLTAVADAPAQQTEQETKSLSVLHRIKVEAFDHSQVMDHLANLTDLYGPRLTASPEFEQAAEWAMQALKNFGVSNVHEEKWGPFGRSWSVESYTVDMLTPRYSHLVAAPMAWSSPTDGMQDAEAIYAPFHIEHWFELKKDREELARYEEKWRGKLKGKVVLVIEMKPPKLSTEPAFVRYGTEQLAQIGNAPTPTIRRDITLDQLDFPKDEGELRKYFNSLPNSVINQIYAALDDFLADVGVFFKQESVAGVVWSSSDQMHNGIVRVGGAGSYTTKKPMAPPTFVVTEEQYTRMQRLLEKKQSVRMRMDLRTKFSGGDVDAANIIGEIPGQSKSDEVVMIGAHFDSWHAATGATDNGAGSAVMMEVMRILTAAKLPMARTVKIGLWSGEEQGLFGSRAYVKAHLADLKTGEVKPEHEKFDTYLNLDNGSGKIRGIYLEGNDAIRPLFEKWFAPFRDLGVTTVSLQHTEGTDHLSFDEAGLPAFQFIQDPLDYETLTHHSDVDTYSHAIPEDLMQASAVIADLVYEIANRQEMSPRKLEVQNGKLVR